MSKLRLVAISGPRKGQEFALDERELSVGRDPSSDICLDDTSVSRRHCQITVKALRPTVVDLESRNGTFVNQVPIKQRRLQPGDELRIGECIFVLLAGAEPESPVPAVAFEESRFTTRTIALSPDDSVYLKADGIRGALSIGGAETTRMAAELEVLLRLSAEIPAVRTRERLDRLVLETLFEVAPAERAALLMLGGGGEVVSATGWSRSAGRARACPVPRELVEQVVAERKAVWTGDAPASWLAAPMVSLDRILAVVALQSDGGPTRFDEGHLQLVSAVSLMAAGALENIHWVEQLERDNRSLREEIAFSRHIVGESAVIADVLRKVGRAAPSEATVLVCGESGTGKELVARAVHDGSPRAPRLFVSINCACLPETLLESELFGHEKGAFTGAVALKRGKIEVAQGGTLFLDEIGEMSAACQAKLLRVLQEREFDRVGGTRPIRADVRVVAATNRDLEKAVATGIFRRDLYYRLNVITITMPSLRERREDIPLLANHFLSKWTTRIPRKITGISPAARAYLNHYDWPGNVRELENAIERAVVVGTSEMILPEDLPEALLDSSSPEGLPPASFHEAMKEAKKQLILGAVEQTHGNQTEAAALLGVHPNYLSRMIRQLDLKASVRKATRG